MNWLKMMLPLHCKRWKVFLVYIPNNSISVRYDMLFSKSENSCRLYKIDAYLLNKRSGHMATVAIYSNIEWYEYFLDAVRH